MLHISWYQHVVTSFVECQQQALDRISELEMDKQQAMSRVTHLEEEITSHKAHIATLKNELTAACRRPMSDDGLSDHAQYIPGVVICLYSLSSLQSPLCSDEGLTLETSASRNSLPLSTPS